MVWPALSVSTMSGSPAAAKNVFQPVVVLDDLVGHTAGGDFAGPADHLGHPECAFPVGVLFAAERCGGAVGPGVCVGGRWRSCRSRWGPRRCPVRRGGRAT